MPEQPSAISSAQFAGSLCWAACAQYFVAEAVVRQFTVSAYSMSRNVISDLGAVGCSSALCSPLHAWMNASFCLQGVLIACGAALLRGRRRGRTWAAALAFLALSGLGVLAVGLAPEDRFQAAHYLGAAVHFVSGGAAMLFAGIAAFCFRGRWSIFAVLSVLCGLCTLTGTAVLASGLDPQIKGAIERAAAYPYTAWLAGTGIYFLRSADFQRRADGYASR